MELPDDIQQQFDALMDQNENFFDDGKLDLCIQLHEQAWALFPEPKHAYINEGYALIKGLIDLNLQQQNPNEAEKWLTALRAFDQQKTFGSTEFAIGQVQYAKGNLAEAKTQFQLAYQKSDGRLFEGEDPRYLQLVKEK